MLKEVKIKLLKCELKTAYTAYMTMDTYGAGNQLYNHITGGRLDEAKVRVNSILKELSKLDPTCPKELK